MYILSYIVEPSPLWGALVLIFRGRLRRLLVSPLHLLLLCEPYLVQSSLSCTAMPNGEDQHFFFGRGYVCMCDNERSILLQYTRSRTRCRCRRVCCLWADGRPLSTAQCVGSSRSIKLETAFFVGSRVCTRSPAERRFKPLLFICAHATRFTNTQQHALHVSVCVCLLVHIFFFSLPPPQPTPLQQPDQAQQMEARIESMGYEVGYRLVERACQRRWMGGDQLEAIKFVCKDLWCDVRNLAASRRFLWECVELNLCTYIKLFLSWLRLFFYQRNWIFSAQRAF